MGKYLSPTPLLNTNGTNLKFNDYTDEEEYKSFLKLQERLLEELRQAQEMCDMLGNE